MGLKHVARPSYLIGRRPDKIWDKLYTENIIVILGCTYGFFLHKR